MIQEKKGQFMLSLLCLLAGMCLFQVVQLTAQEEAMKKVYLPFVSNPEPVTECFYPINGGWGLWEAEDIRNDDQVELHPDWTHSRSQSGSNGDGYIYWNGTQYFGAPGPDDTQLTYRVNVEKAGNYWLLIRNYHKGARVDLNNDIWVYSNDGAMKFFNTQYATWSWQSLFEREPHTGSVANIVFESAGIHELVLAPRSSQMYLDQIALVHVDDIETYINRSNQVPNDNTPISCILE